MENAFESNQTGIPRRGRSLRLLVLVLLFCLQGVGFASEEEAGVSREYQVKAAFIYNFTKFVTWPKDHFRSGSEPIIIGVLGSNPFQHELAEAVRNREVQGRRFFVKSSISVDEALGVDLLFVPAGRESMLARETIQVLHMSGVLTVGESPCFAGKGGIIIFTLQDEKVRFLLNTDEALANGFHFSAQVLQLALPVGKEK